MKITKFGRIVALVAAVGIAGLSGLAQSQEPEPTWNPPKEPAYDLEKYDTDEPPPGGSFPEVSPDLPLKVEGIPGTTLFETQQWFDIFAWQTFIALNWPTSSENYGQPDKSVKIGSSGDIKMDRVWESFIAPEKVFKSAGTGPDPYPKVPEETSVLTSTAKRTHLLNEVDEAFFNLEKPLPPIIDVNKNYARYEIGINKTEYDFIHTNKLYSKDGQDAYIKTLPVNTAGEGAMKELWFPPGSIEVKAAWKKMGPGDDESRFYTRTVNVEEPFAPGKPTIENQKYGLVGLHIMYLAENPKGKGIKEWVWPTFEHVDNAPISDLRPKDPKDHIVSEWEWEGKSWVRKKLKPAYSFYDTQDTLSSITSIGGFSPASKAAMDQVNAIYNGTLGNYYQTKKDSTIAIPGRKSSQIAKVITDNNAIVAARWTAALNDAMQEELKEIDPNNVWANYRLVSTQWPTQSGLAQTRESYITAYNKLHQKNPLPPLGAGTIRAGNPAPVSLANAVAESYMQINGSCMNCHSGASFGGSDGKEAFADFSFMLQRAK